MREAPSVDAFQRDPIGSYILDRCFLCWSFDATLWGCIYWGSFTEDDFASLAKALDAELHADVPPHAGIADLRRLEGVTPHLHDLLAKYYASRWGALRTRIVQQAVVRPWGGMLGSMVAGFYQVYVPPYPFRVVTDPREALTWFGREQDAGVLDVLERRIHEGAARSPIVVALRALLARDTRGAALDSASRSLGVSTRTLQRQLKEAGTSFQSELQAMRLRGAQRMLLETDAKLTAIATELGFASLQHFSMVFRKATGESPGAWRARRAVKLDDEGGETSHPPPVARPCAGRADHEG